MLKEIVIKILKYVNAKKLRIEKEVILDRKTSYSFSTKFEGKNKIGKNACINNSKVGFATYIGKECIFDNTIIGKYCCIANNVKPIKYEIEFCDFPGEHENDTKIVQTKVTPITSYTFKKSIVKAIENN